MPQGLRTAWRELRDRHLAAGKIGTEPALTLGAVAIAALRLDAGP